MKKRRAPKPTLLLMDVMAKLGGLTVRERFIPGDTTGEIIYGTYCGNVIEINPVPAIVDTVIHECLHAVHPDWSEATVKQQTARLFHRLTEAEMKKIYEVYQSKAR